MTTEEARARLRTRLEETYGVDETSILMDRPPGGWSELATNRALDALEARLDRRFNQFEESFNGKLDLKLGALEDRIDRKLADLEGRIDRAFAVQAWRLVTSMIALGGVLVAAIKL